MPQPVGRGRPRGKEEVHKFELRLPLDLMEQYRALARLHDRSLNKEFIAALRAQALLARKRTTRRLPDEDESVAS